MLSVFLSLHRHQHNRGRITNKNIAETAEEEPRDFAYQQIMIKIIDYFGSDPRDGHITERRLKYNALCQNNDAVHRARSNKYSFGYQMKYGYDGEQLREHPPPIQVFAKYVSLKQELITNSIMTIESTRFTTEYIKAEQHFNSEHRRRHYHQMTLEHTLALMMYCNFDALQRAFTRTYYENDDENRHQDSDAMVEYIRHRHSNYFHLGPLIKRAVLDFGVGTKDIPFYHGIEKKLLFP